MGPTADSSEDDPDDEHLLNDGSVADAVPDQEDHVDDPEIDLFDINIRTCAIHIILTKLNFPVFVTLINTFPIHWYI